MHTQTRNPSEGQTTPDRQSTSGDGDTDTHGGSGKAKAPIQDTPRDDTPFAGRVHDWDNTRDRYEMIAEAAYFKAEKRGFALGEDELDWLEAEQELIEAMEGDRDPVEI